MSSARLSKYEAILLELGEIEMKICTTINPASFFLEREEEEGDHIYLKHMEEEMQQISQ